MTKKRSPQPNSPKNHYSKPHQSTDHELINHLNRIINTQDRLNEANLKIDEFISIAVQQVHKLTHASGTVIELVDGDNLVYRAALGSIENLLVNEWIKTIAFRDYALARIKSFALMIRKMMHALILKNVDNSTHVHLSLHHFFMKTMLQV